MCIINRLRRHIDNDKNLRSWSEDISGCPSKDTVVTDDVSPGSLINNRNLVPSEGGNVVIGAVSVEESITKFDIVKLQSLDAVECWASDAIWNGSFGKSGREEINVVRTGIDTLESIPSVSGNLRWYVIPSGQWGQIAYASVGTVCLQSVITGTLYNLRSNKLVQRQLLSIHKVVCFWCYYIPECFSRSNHFQSCLRVHGAGSMRALQLQICHMFGRFVGEDHSR